ncbi:MAG: ATP-binding cassette domain-containing protein [Bryobacteraceae bacterium]
MANAAVEVRGLKKSYGPVEAVCGIDLDVREGEIFGLIGPDGAGKTSVFQILGGVMQAGEGEASMLGKPAREAREYVGYLTQTFSLYQDLSVNENLRYVGELRRVPRAQVHERGMKYLQMFGMERFTDRLAGKLSGGMKQKLALSCALIAEPKILLLDEPTTGVDPISRREFWQALADLSGSGMTVVVATPYLDEAERCHRVALMHNGLIQQTGTPAELRGSLGLHRLELRTNDLQGAEALLNESALKKTEGIHDAQRFGDRLDVMVEDAEAGEQRVRELVPDITDLRRSEPTLENTFVSILRNLGGTIPEASFPGTRPARTKRDDIAIGASDLTKRFGDFEAVKHVNIAVKYGEIYGLLGANGAGKTTTIKMLCGLSSPTSGETQLVGAKGRLRSSKVRCQVGYMSQKFSLYDELTIDENLRFFAGVYGVPLEEFDKKKAWVLQFAGLEGKADQVTGSLPGGWKQRVAFGSAIMHEPAVLFLDEPTSGVDPLARRGFWRMINWLADRGAAILVTTHYLEEAEQCNRLGFMVAGELVEEGSPGEVKQKVATEQGRQASDYSLDDVFVELVERSQREGKQVQED